MMMIQKSLYGQVSDRDHLQKLLQKVTPQPTGVVKTLSGPSETGTIHHAEECRLMKHTSLLTWDLLNKGKATLSHPEIEIQLPNLVFCGRLGSFPHIFRYSDHSSAVRCAVLKKESDSVSPLLTQIQIDGTLHPHSLEYQRTRELTLIIIFLRNPPPGRASYHPLAHAYSSVALSCRAAGFGFGLGLDSTRILKELG